ncbi:MAG: MerR family transcriptional regulator [Ignavibacteriaceae bacterium]|nr:MerR family transcriptional regulator [Ignavibacteriaceae bacterium]
MKDLSIKKLYYSISEVSKITEVEQYVLRYWETEFEQLNPQKNRAGNRIYTNKDIQTILLIKNLLRDKKYTIEGAKNILSLETADSGAVQEDINLNAAKSDNIKLSNKKEPPSIKKDLEEIKSVLLTLKSYLS